MSDFDAYQEQENEPEAVAPALLLSEPRRCEAISGAYWVRDAFALFRRAPAMWLAITVIYLALTIVLTPIPGVNLILMLIGPVFSGGVYLGCAALERDEDLEISHLFDGFRTRFAQLALVGMLYLAAIIVICLCILLIGGIVALLVWTVHQLVGTHLEAVLAPIALAIGGATLILALVAVLLAMTAVWFAPQLVVLHDMEPVAAVRLSFRGCMRNWAPLTVLAGLAFALAVLAVLPMFLGFLLWVPLWLLSSYIAYKDIFLERVDGGQVSRPLDI